MKSIILACTLACFLACVCLGPEPFSASRDGLTVLGELTVLGGRLLAPIRASSREARGVRSARPDSGVSCEARGERISRVEADPPSLGSI
eukprot:scaffold103623_cov63-Phaeocystis_antarctica.AAC.1